MRKITQTKTRKYFRYYLGFLINRFTIDIAPRILLSFELFKAIKKEDLDEEHMEITVRLMSNESVIIEKSKLLFNNCELELSRFETDTFSYTFETQVPDRLNTTMPVDEFYRHTKSELHKFFYYKVSKESIKSLSHKEQLNFRFYTGLRSYRYNFTKLADYQLKQVIHIFQFDKPSPKLTGKIRRVKIQKRLVQLLLGIVTVSVPTYIFSNMNYLETIVNREDVTDDRIGVGGLLFILLMGLLIALFRKRIFH